jgi:hypothetical protein
LRTAARSAGVLGAYLLLAVLATLPLATQATDHVVCDASAASGACIGTPVLNAWAMGWVMQRLPRDPLRLFDASIFFPYSDTLAHSEHLIGPALLAAPFVGLTGNLVLAYNLVTLRTLALAGLGMWLFARELVGDSRAAFAAGLVYAFHSFNLNELVRIQTLSNQWFPLLLLALLRYSARPSFGRAAAAALAYAAQSLSGMYWALYAPALVATAVAFLAWQRRMSARALARLAAVFLPAVLLVAGVFLPYLRLARLRLRPRGARRRAARRVLADATGEPSLHGSGPPGPTSWRRISWASRRCSSRSLARCGLPRRSGPIAPLCSCWRCSGWRRASDCESSWAARPSRGHTRCCGPWSRASRTCVTRSA